MLMQTIKYIVLMILLMTYGLPTLVQADEAYVIRKLDAVGVEGYIEISGQRIHVTGTRDMETVFLHDGGIRETLINSAYIELKECLIESARAAGPERNLILSHGTIYVDMFLAPELINCILKVQTRANLIIDFVVWVDFVAALEQNEIVRENNLYEKILEIDRKVNIQLIPGQNVSIFEAGEETDRRVSVLDHSSIIRRVGPHNEYYLNVLETTSRPGGLIPYLAGYLNAQSFQSLRDLTSGTKLITKISD